MATKKTVKKTVKKAPAKKTKVKAKRGGGRPRKDQFDTLQDTYRVAASDLANVKETFPFGSLWTTPLTGRHVRTVLEVRTIFVDDDQVMALCHEGSSSLLVQAGWLRLQHLVRLTALENAEIAAALENAEIAGNGTLFESGEAEAPYRVDTNAAYAYVPPEDREAYGRDKGIPPYKEVV